MKLKHIKGLLKTLILTTIISLSMVSMAFADDNIKTIQDFCNKYMFLDNGTINNVNHYVSKVTIDDETTTIKYLDGSWYSYNSSKFLYEFKPIESNEPLYFSSEDFMKQCIYDYDNIKNNDLMLNDKNSCLRGFGKHSDKIYVENLKTDDDLKNYAIQWLKDNYNLTLDIPISYDTISGNIGGYNTVINGKPIEIKINNKAKNIDLLAEKFLIHELSHYALCKQGKEYHDGTESFTQECIKNGSNTCEGKVGILHSNLKCTL